MSIKNSSVSADTVIRIPPFRAPPPPQGERALPSFFFYASIACSTRTSQFWFRITAAKPSTFQPIVAI